MGTDNNDYQESNMDIVESDNTYRTSDFACAAAISLFQPVDAIDKTDAFRAVFVFEKTNHLLALLEAYWRGELKVNPRAYHEQLKVMKTRLRE